MGWSNAVITNGGLSLIAQAVSGGTLSITSAGLGGGTVDAMALLAQTAITSPLTVPAVISAMGELENGISVRVQIRNTGVTAVQHMKQVGLFARIGEKSPVLFAIMQCDNGIGEEIPPESEYPDFMIEFNAAVAVSNTDNIVVTISTSAVITRGALEEELKNYTTKDSFTALSESVNDLSENKANQTDMEDALAGKADLSDIPTSLPANGGNAETLGGKHAADFAAASHNHDARYYIKAEVNNLLAGKASSSHTHTATQIGGLPASLPANGGNADTVDNYHANDFCQLNASSRLTTSINQQFSHGTYQCNAIDTLDFPTEFGRTWGYLTVFRNGSICYQLIMLEGGIIIYRSAIIGQTEWSKWVNLANPPANGGNASTANIATYVRTLSAAGASHGDGWLMTAQHNRAGDGLFRIFCGDGSVGTSVNYADNSNNSNTVGGVPVVTSAALGLHQLSSGTAAANAANCLVGCWYGQHS